MIGLISDTHGLLREEVVYNLSNCNLIIHTGDIGKFEVIENLEKIAKVEFIRGNCDKDKNIAKEDKIIDVYNIRIYLVHDISKVNLPISMAKLKILDNERYYDSLKLIDKNIYRYKCYEVEFIPIVI